VQSLRFVQENSTIRNYRGNTAGGTALFHAMCDACRAPVLRRAIALRCIVRSFVIPRAPPTAMPPRRAAALRNPTPCSLTAGAN
jgi:hypothetical protein